MKKENLEKLNRLKELKDAEDFLKFFNIDYDSNIVNTYRLHILKRFGGYISQIKIEEDPSASDLLQKYKEALIKAYNDFLSEDKESKKFYHLKKQGKEFIPISKLTKIEKF
ncbi:MAG: nitrogenase-stabilizing/protective protein NifW [Hydrogenothermaceae bacterium]|nr:nitrogenase-stabilizing/protective protein NifW [Hydrogenothermaceae bacterium]